jgi:REP element-mobilizing transposase RayT
MGIRKTQFISGEHYHIYNRGNSRQKIFLDGEDYDRFMKLLFVTNTANYKSYKDQIINTKKSAYLFKRDLPYTDTLAFVLMPNHFHIYTRARGAGNEISEFLRKLCQSYTQYFNAKYSRTGGLFEGRFKAEHVPDDRYAKYLFSYIHLNPIKLIQHDWKEKGIKNILDAKKFLTTYKYSSFIDYLNDENNKERLESLITDRFIFRKLHSTGEKISEKIFQWLEDYTRAPGAGVK